MTASPIRLATPVQSAPEPAVPRGLASPTARSLAVRAVTLGVVADSLFRLGADGLAFGIWMALVALNLACLVWRDGRRLPRESAAWLVTACAFAFALAWRNSELITFLDVLAALGSLAMAAIRLRDPRAALFAAHFRETIAAAIKLAANAAAGLFPVVRRELDLSGNDDFRGRATPFVRAFVLATVVFLVFGSLLRSADPIFASFVDLPNIDFDDMLGHTIVIAIVAWAFGGWARTALVPATRRPVPAYGFTLRSLDVTTVLGTLDLLFALFVVAQLGWVFGGEAFLREHTGLTAAEYARKGFFQMVWIVALVVPVLVITRGTLSPGAELKRRHTLLSIPAIALLGVMIASAVVRMKMYVHFFGLTTDRLYPLVFMGWLAFVLAWLAATVLRGRGRPFAAGSILSGLVTLALLNVGDPDAFVARVNVERSAGPGHPALDLAHLASLDGGAVALATHAVLTAPANASDRDVCDAAWHLMTQWGPDSYARRDTEKNADWRVWNADKVAAMRVVGRNSSALLRVMHDRCRAAKATEAAAKAAKPAA